MTQSIETRIRPGDLCPACLQGRMNESNVHEDLSCHACMHGLLAGQPDAATAAQHDRWTAASALVGRIPGALLTGEEQDRISRRLAVPPASAPADAAQA